MSFVSKQRQIVLNYRPLMSDTGWQALIRALGIAVVNGLVQGFALLTLLPALTSLSTGDPVYGLGFGWWWAILVAFAIAGAYLEYTQSMVAFVSALDLVEQVHQRLGDKIAKIPLG